MLLFADGFDHYATADIAKKWNATFGTVTINATAGRRGGGSYRTNGFGQALAKAFPAASSFVVGMSIKVSSFTIGATPQPIIALWDAATLSQCELSIRNDGALIVTRGSTPLTGGASVGLLLVNTEYYVEWKVTIADSIAANSCKVRVNGVDFITVPAGQDTKASASVSTASFVRIGQTTGLPSGITLDIDDFYICDQSGTTNNDFLGDIRVDTLYPNADGMYSQWTPSAGTNHSSLVDEATPNLTDYNYALTPGLRDSYAFQDLPSLVSSTVYGVQINAAMLKDDAGNKQVAPFVRSGGTDSDGTTAALGTSQTYVSQIWEMNGGTAWTQASVNASEFGVKVVV